MFQYTQKYSLVLLIIFGWTANGCDQQPETTLVEIDEAAESIFRGFCERQFSCDCENNSYLNLTACAQGTEGMVQNLERAGRQAGLTYYPECIGGWLDRLAERGCAPPNEPEPSSCEQPCFPYAGGQPLGSACEAMGSGLSNCAQGLSCDDGWCENPCEIWADQRLEQGEYCGGARNCAVDLFCNANVVCEALPGLGETCPTAVCNSHTRCETELASENNWRCIPLIAVTQTCRGHRECDSGYCPAGFCEPVPELGQSCAGTQACAFGLQCLDDVCAIADANICEYQVPQKF